MKTEIVHYCPGDAIGTAAGLTVELANALLKDDTNFLKMRQRAGITARCWPHLHGWCDRCAKADRPAPLFN